MIWTLWLYLVASFALMLAVKIWARVTGRGCRPVATWNCLGVGIFFDHANGRMFIFPLPFIGVLVQFGPAQSQRVWDRRQAA